MHLYYHPVSSNARRVTMAAHHLGIKLDLVEINLASAADRRRLEEVNPNSKIPVLLDEDFVLTESCAIMQYLADCTPGQTVYPDDPIARADVNRWMFWATQHFAPAIGVIVWENVWKKVVHGIDTDPVELARGQRDLARFATVLDAHLADRQWLCGDAVTLADYAMAAPMMYLERANVPLTQYQHIMAWFGRVQDLPAWRHTTAVF
ncbi:glutathione S-transferase family protein [Massilia solisilvae]|uniref:Glutathione S-transferase family protein n=1 Tax=Massilia solisilvae TaxID=1811225 RepID=A0ABT2BMD5_9BURK|nr:glutathione S-transferase family protein [Massilia solisilvae]MCS0609685.1 glutathione S-transferase family protein [Massilia solisilvae]